ncbi:MAG: hypothetical protein NVS3B3_01660 [Aquirhabdus sp.]
MGIILRLKYALVLTIITETILTILNAFFHFMDDTGYPFSKFDLTLYLFMFVISPIFWRKIKLKNDDE